MAKVLILYYSSWGHVMKMAEAVAEGARSAGADVTIKRVKELVPQEVAESSGYLLDQPYPEADPSELADYDAVIVGTPTRFGVMCSQMKNFWDQTGALWANGALVGKVGAVFASTGTQHGGQETTITSTQVLLLHQGFVIVGLPYAFQGLTKMDEITGGSPYGASTLSAADGSRMPSENELDGARYQGRHVATIAAKLAA
ncbi:NAD(P)H:quinone oxidoreductase [Afifella sp. IM 167]|uniref:NAD(P)H:quinone oxidoreductase n=1 Tax=Afifella sp. IM 167 TaxID=2033586 RepID=UPI001CCEBCE6|nr:NAD(P)H:quinone oxidoreductase [Afifella sp. IM 167]MBZ8133489.1 NAD(P)H:quinone oxidoreductase [Afifella sp. IM 167]